MGISSHSLLIDDYCMVIHVVYRYVLVDILQYIYYYYYYYIYIYSRTSIIRTPVCHFNVNSVQISEFVRISELSDKIHYLAS